MLSVVYTVLSRLCVVYTVLATIVLIYTILANIFYDSLQYPSYYYLQSTLSWLILCVVYTVLATIVCSRAAYDIRHCLVDLISLDIAGWWLVSASNHSHQTQSIMSRDV